MEFSRSRRFMRIVRSANAGRQFLAQTGIQVLEAGKEPDRIDRDFPMANDGIIGRFVSGWPYDGNSLHIPHHYVPRRPYTVQPFQRMIDTGVTIPSVYVGEPQS